MGSRSRRLAFGTIAAAVGLAGWLCVIAARWDRIEGVAFALLVVALIAAGYRAWFAPSPEGRDWWFGFALFGLFHLLSPAVGPRQPLLLAGVDRLADLALGNLDENGALIRDGVAHSNVLGRRDRPTRLGKALDSLTVFQSGAPSRAYPRYVLGVTKLFACLIFGLFGGLTAAHLGRKSVAMAPAPTGRSRVPLLGLTAMLLVAAMAGITFVLNSRPDLIEIRGGWFREAPGSLAGHFALYQAEVLIVLFAALEARFGDRSCRPWWLGFALFGGVYLLLIDTPMFDYLPSRWLRPLHQSALERFVADRASLVVQARGLIMFDYATQEFLRLGYSWAPLLGFLAAAWIGSGLARGVELMARRSPERSGERTKRSSIARMMALIGAVGVFLTAVRGSSDLSTAALGDTLAAVLAFAALWSVLGRGPGRSWWFGFSLVGGVDFLQWAIRAPQPAIPGMSATPWPTHEVVERLHHAAFVRATGTYVPSLFMSFDEKMTVVLATYTQSRAAILMVSCLPLAWLGGFVAQYIERRSTRAAGGSPCIADASPPPR